MCDLHHLAELEHHDPEPVCARRRHSLDQAFGGQRREQAVDRALAEAEPTGQLGDAELLLARQERLSSRAALRTVDSPSEPVRGPDVETRAGLTPSGWSSVHRGRRGPLPAAADGLEHRPPDHVRVGGHRSVASDCASADNVASRGAISCASNACARFSPARAAPAISSTSASRPRTRLRIVSKSRADRRVPVGQAGPDVGGVVGAQSRRPARPRSGRAPCATPSWCRISSNAGPARFVDAARGPASTTVS